MKRLSILCLFLLAYTTTWAQVNLSLDIGYGNKGYEYGEQGLSAYNGSLPKGQSCYLAPRLGYRFGDEVAVGIQPGATYSTYTYADGYYDPVATHWKQSATTVREMLGASVRGYLRLRCFAVGDWSLHLELSGTYGMGWGWDTRSEDNVASGWALEMKRRRTEHSLCAQVVPVATYALSRHVGVDIYLNLAALTYSQSTTRQWPYGDIASTVAAAEAERETTTQTFDIGLNATNTQLLTIGFGYSF